ncbi:hydroxypyruvate isomerase [Tamaricihabitans halophyticus]|uniref:Hydroxypyruvate isomerase n=1 Tax=Tamaricihabitans halophyticus TaxID=1262583 RepID=A0A4R2R2H4_9PSEU|nr:TIM barrel protein [Tamaricihabitans halophyticus]TCP56942.1 hydroxypyruvate isomerase [Tamaricihabitans halophyticus]
MTAASIRFDLNCSIQLTDLPLANRPAAAKAAGFDAVEFWWPFSSATPGDAEVDAFVRSINDAGVALVGLNFVDGLPEHRGFASVPDARQRFRDNVDIAVGIAEATGCRALNALYGNRIPGVDPRTQDELARENLVHAAAAADRIGAVVLLEALNSYESPDYPIVSAKAALDLIAELPAGNIRFLADLYHLARMDEDLPALIAAHASEFGHVQIADTPGRGAPGTGELDFAALLSGLVEHGYTGCIGAEYKGSASFAWLPELKGSQ